MNKDFDYNLLPYKFANKLISAFVAGRLSIYRSNVRPLPLLILRIQILPMKIVPTLRLTSCSNLPWE